MVQKSMTAFMVMTKEPILAISAVALEELLLALKTLVPRLLLTSALSLMEARLMTISTATIREPTLATFAAAIVVLCHVQTEFVPLLFQHALLLTGLV
jgi:hypothetical protein